MNEQLYDAIFRRKSFHLFRNTGELKLSKQELEDIKETYKKLQPLDDSITTEIVIHNEPSSSCHRGNEYTIYFYSEKKGNWLANIGYLGEQLDLYLTAGDIGTLWYGMGKPEEKQHDGLEFVIMMGIKKALPETFRKDMFKSKRKAMEDVWHVQGLEDIGNIVRFAPSACNFQPWLVEGEEGQLTVYRHRLFGKRGIMPLNMVTYYNRIDIGIFLCFLELCLQHEGLTWTRTLYSDSADKDEENNLMARYQLGSEEHK